MIRRTAWLAALLLPGVALAWVMDGPRLVEQLAEHHERTRRAVRIEARLTGISETWPERVTLDVDPRRGVRAQDDRGQRWIVPLSGSALGTRLPLPPWLPHLAALAIAEPLPLAEWLSTRGVDLTRNELGRCGEDDCFVLGGRDGSGQLWLDKYTYRVRELRLPDGRRELFDGHRPWADKGGQVWPQSIRLFDRFGELGVLEIESVASASLGSRDFEEAWLRGD